MPFFTTHIIGCFSFFSLDRLSKKHNNYSLLYVFIIGHLIPFHIKFRGVENKFKGKKGQSSASRAGARLASAGPKACAVRFQLRAFRVRLTRRDFLAPLEEKRKIENIFCCFIFLVFGSRNEHGLFFFFSCRGSSSNCSREGLFCSSLALCISS